MNEIAAPQTLWQRRWLRWILKATGLFIAIVVILILVVDKVIMPSLTRHGEEIPAPRLEGKSLERAQEMVSQFGGTMEIIERRFSTDFPDGTVIEQRPSADAPIKIGRVFRVVVSRGSELVDVPRVRGQTVRQAELILQEAGFIVGGRAPSSDSSFPVGSVVGTIPGSGSRLPRKSVVNLLVNAPVREDYTWCPNLAGLNIEEARVILRERGLLLGRVDRRFNRDVDPGTVLEQSAAAGDEFPVGTEIDLVISRDR